MITKFEGRYFFLSNSFPSEIEHLGIKYPTMDHYICAMMVDRNQYINGVYYTPNDIREFISKIKNIKDINKLQKSIKIRKNWDLKKLDFMEWGLKEKFKILKNRELLISTGENEILFLNSNHENFFGKCTCTGCYNLGENNFGKILMNIRNEYKKEKHLKPDLI